MDQYNMVKEEPQEMVSLFTGMLPDTDLRRKKAKPKLDAITHKTIKAPGLATTRTAQACDRCRAKKSKCDGKVPACSLCAAIGIKCIVSDKLSRRAFPKGYTETLEDRVRQLEAENLKLQGLLDLRDEQLAMSTSLQGPKLEEDEQRPSTGSPDYLNPHSVLQSHNHDESCACCSNPHTVHERLVSLAGSVYNGGEEVSVPGSVFSDEETSSLFSTDDFPAGDFPTNYSSFPNKEVSPAPGAFAAATAIEQMQRQRNFLGQQLNEESKQQALTSLVAASIPRSTEETLFIPTLLARICQVYGYNSQPAIITANALASLKENSHFSIKADQNSEHEKLLALIMDHASPKLEQHEAMAFLRHISLPNKLDLDYLLTLYFQQWGNVCPILNKNSFLKGYVRLSAILENGQYSQDQEDNYELLEKLGALMVLVVSLAMLSKKFSLAETQSDFGYSETLNQYDKLIHEFIKPNCILTRFCSIQSLQILTLALQYCLAIGDVTTCYELRGRVITMAQQLRLHRCPAAVLGISKDKQDVHLQNFMQGERRILFWCIYCLDAYSSLNLGIPRLLKDYEIECAMPFSGKNDDIEDDKDNENILIINNTKLTIFGKVSKIALSVMQYCKVLGNIMDSIFSRSGTYEAMEQALQKDQILECWRRELPLDLKFEIDVNGFSLKDSSNNKLNGGNEGTNWNVYTKQQLLAIFLYYHAKILIYLPVISKYGLHHNVGVSMKERLNAGQGDLSTVVSSMTMIQQSSIQILELLKSTVASLHLLPLPVNISREQARCSLLVAKGSLDYIKGGPLHQNLRLLLMDTLGLFKAESGRKIPCNISVNAVRLLEFAVLSILGLNLNKGNANGNLRKKVTSQPYNKAVNQNPGASPYAMGVDLQRKGNEPQRVPAAEAYNWAAHENAPSGSSFAPHDLPELELMLSFTSDESKNTNKTPTKEEDLDELMESLDFAPLKMNYNSEMMMEEFVTDGSLGLVPFLNESSYNDEDLKHLDKTDDESAFSFNWN